MGCRDLFTSRNPLKIGALRLQKDLRSDRESREGHILRTVCVGPAILSTFMSNDTSIVVSINFRFYLWAIDILAFSTVQGEGNTIGYSVDSEFIVPGWSIKCGGCAGSKE